MNDLWCRLGVHVCGFALCLAFQLALAANVSAEAPADAERANLEVEPAADAADRRPISSAEPPAREVAKLLPDLRILKGSPATALDLSEAFSGEVYSGDVSELTLQVVFDSKKGKVVGYELRDGRYLLLTPGKVGKTELIIEATGPDFHLHSKFTVEVWEPDYSKLVLVVIGGLGIFLLGMKNMSDGLQAVAGRRLRRMIGSVTDNRFLATGVGILVTMLVQSSSITTVMVVGFVNSGFMSLTQAIGVIMGANIGTTITGWILTLKIGKYGLPILGLGAFFFLFSRRERIRYYATICMGLGMIFLGLELMKDAFAVVKELPEFERWFATFDANTYLGVLKCAAVGCILTFIVQSSSATLGITIGLAQIGVIPFETAAALVMGENVGTTITAWLAAFGATTTAKRAAYFHMAFNLVGVLWITAIFQWYAAAIRAAFIGDSVDPLATTAAIATSHTVFNITNTLFFLPLVNLSARWLTRLVPERPGVVGEETHLTNLDMRMVETPVLAVEQTRGEVLRMADGCRQMMDWLGQVLAQDEPDEQLMEKIQAEERHLDAMQTEFVNFMSDLLSANVPHEITDEIRQQLRMVDEYESVSDSISTALKAYRKPFRLELKFPPDEHANVVAVHNMVATYLDEVSAAYQSREHDVLDHARHEGSQITRHIKMLGRQIIDKTLETTPESRLDPRIGTSYTRQLTAYRRVRDHVLNIAETLAGEK